MWDDLWEWASSPLGSGIVGGVAVALIVAIAARVSKNARKMITAIFRWIFGIRITTKRGIQRRVDAAISERQRHVVPARWVISARAGTGAKGLYNLVLVNVALGSTARAVHVDSESFGFRFLSSADWEIVEPHTEAVFQGHWDRMMYGDPGFTVAWTDEAGQRRTDFVSV
ncbi:hypothetical protein [Curtobacterium sp. Curtsp57]|uniref:hypothetical protein n=1 Tax=Curtobacterium sp. Curtsp57 TaxID=3243047 RepID=UPI0039B4B806